MGKSIVIIWGNIKDQPELKYTTGGTAVMNITIPTDSGWGENKSTAWNEVVLWGKTAEFVSKHFNKGSFIIVNGEIEQQSWNDRETGKKRHKMLIKANSVDFGGRGDSVRPESQQEQNTAPAPQAYQPQQQTVQPQASPQLEDIPQGGEDDIPF